VRGHLHDTPDFERVAEHFRCVEVLVLHGICSFTAIAEMEIPRNVQKELRYISLDHYTELKLTVRENTCDLPDGNIIFVVADRFRCVEVLDIRKNLYANVVLSLTEKLCCSWCRLRYRAQIYG